MKANLDYLESLAGHSAVSVALGGGMTRTRTFAPIVANVLGREILVAPSPHSSAVGAWMCAATATGRFQHLGEAADWARERMRSVEPDAYTWQNIRNITGTGWNCRSGLMASTCDGRPMELKWQEERQAVLAAAQRMAARGLTVGTSGNVSMRLSADVEGKNLMGITPSELLMTGCA